MKTIWHDVLAQIATRMNPSSFTTWFSPTRQTKFEQNILEVAVPDKYFVNWLEEHYLETILDILKTLAGSDVKVTFIIDEEHLEDISVPVAPSENTVEPSVKSVFQQDTPGLNQKYTFDTFVVGGSNQFAHAASLAVAAQPSKAYNPLFIYGGVGLGKTHLMHAIGHAVRRSSQAEIRLYYLSFEQFMNELINAIRYDTIQQFRDKYRNIDLLLIDDIQFIAGKERTQEEFFHTFNALYNAQKQIVISCDCPPKKIPTLEERLRSRFEWGLIVDIQPPDFETKVAILKKKAETERINLPNDVAMFIATKIQSNIRALEGCLTKIAAHSTLSREKISIDLTQRVLNDILDATDPHAHSGVTVEHIQRVVANHYNINIDDMKSATRSRNLAFPRQIAMYLARKLTALSLPLVGQAFGGKDHTTIMHACQKIETLIRNDAEFQKEVELIEQSILA